LVPCGVKEEIRKLFYKSSLPRWPRPPIFAPDPVKSRTEVKSSTVLLAETCYSLVTEECSIEAEDLHLPSASIQHGFIFGMDLRWPETPESQWGTTRICLDGRGGEILMYSK